MKNWNSFSVLNLGTLGIRGQLLLQTCASAGCLAASPLVTTKYASGCWKTPPGLEKPRRIVLVSGIDPSLICIRHCVSLGQNWEGPHLSKGGMDGSSRELELQRSCISSPSHWGPLLPVSSGDHRGKGWQLQCAPQPPVHQHQEQNDLPVCQLERQRLPGAEDLRFPAANDFSNLLRQRVLGKLQQFWWWGW